MDGVNRSRWLTLARADVMYFGLISTGIGLAYLLCYAIEGRKEKLSTANPGAPQPPVARD